MIETFEVKHKSMGPKSAAEIKSQLLSEKSKNYTNPGSF